MLATVVTTSRSHNYCQAFCSFKTEVDCIWYALEAYKMDFHLCVVKLISLITASNIFSVLLKSQHNKKLLNIHGLETYYVPSKSEYRKPDVDRKDG